MFEDLYSPIAIGKEANVFVAKKKDGNYVVVKIYRLETCDFNRMHDYIKQDPRYVKLKKNKRQIIFSWTQREYRHLMKARAAGVRVPTPINLLDNIIVMEFIGDENPAPQMKSQLPKNKKEFFDKIILSMKKLYKEGVVHGDLSGFNILNSNETPVFIDFSQATLTKSNAATDYLRRDVKNIVNFFKKLSLEEDEEKILKKITQ